VRQVRRVYKRIRVVPAQVTLRTVR